MTIRLNNAERHYEDVLTLGERLYEACKSSSDASFAEATYICSQLMGSNVASEVLDMIREVEVNIEDGEDEEDDEEDLNIQTEIWTVNNTRCCNLLLEARQDLY